VRQITSRRAFCADSLLMAAEAHILSIDLATLTPAERRDLANALLRAAWSATLVETRALLLGLLVETDPDVVGEGL
jgi:hypothetical protein